MAIAKDINLRPTKVDDKKENPPMSFYLGLAVTSLIVIVVSLASAMGLLNDQGSSTPVKRNEPRNPKPMRILVGDKNMYCDYIVGLPADMQEAVYAEHPAARNCRYSITERPKVARPDTK